MFINESSCVICNLKKECHLYVHVNVLDIITCTCILMLTCFRKAEIICFCLHYLMIMFNFLLELHHVVCFYCYVVNCHFYCESTVSSLIIVDNLL